MAAIEIALNRGLMMDLLLEASQLFRDEDRNFLRIDGKGMRMQLDVHSLAIPDVKLIRTPRFSDARGYFCETFQRADFAAHGLGSDFLQDNQSSSARREPFAACTFNDRLSLRRSWFVCCAGVFSMWLSIFAVRHQALGCMLPKS